MKTNFLKQLGRVGAGQAIGLGALAGGAMAWWQGDSMMSGAFYGGLAGGIIGHNVKPLFGALGGAYEKGVNAIWDMKDRPNVIQNSIRSFKTNRPTQNMQYGMIGTGAALAGGMFATHNGHKRKAAGFNANRGNYIGG